MKMNQNETLGDWCKWLEKNFSPEIMIPTLPVIIRLDGNNFHSWTRGLERPFDSRLTALMQETTAFLVKETNALIGYTQSDEITLVLHSADKRTAIYHDGKKQKILSKLTAKTVNFFNQKRKELLPEHDKVAVFDCRIYQATSLQDAGAQVLWRENDAIKNSVSMLAQSLFSHKELQGLRSQEMLEKMLIEKGVDWNNLSTFQQRGSYFKRFKKTTPFTPEELKALPPKHKAHSDPDLIIERSVIENVIFPQLNLTDSLEETLFGVEV